jgi:CdiI immunity protein
MSNDCDSYHYLPEMLGGYFHQDCYAAGVTNDDIIDEYIKTNWSYDRLGLRADIERLLHLHPDDAFDAMRRMFSMNAYPELDNTSMARWLRGVLLRLKATENDPPKP